jgi:hypothetical protein
MNSTSLCPHMGHRRALHLPTKILEFPPPRSPVFKASIQVCGLFAVQGGTILAARFPAWPIPRLFNTLDTPAYAEVPMVTPHSNEAYLQHATLSFNCPSNKSNQPLSPHGSQKGATLSDKNWSFHLQTTQCSEPTFRSVISSLCKAGRFWLLGFPPGPFLAALKPTTPLPTQNFRL